MKKTKILIMTLIMVMLPLSYVRVSAEPADMPLETGIVDSSNNQDNPHKTPTIIPKVSIEDYTLYFNTPCDGYVLRLVDEFDNVVYPPSFLSEPLPWCFLPISLAPTSFRLLRASIASMVSSPCKTIIP
ncbi:MAG: hypothetical protein K6A96_09125 [Prevotella sp.]|nr:hypothetical protein [Prevotella sp.]